MTDLVDSTDRKSINQKLAAEQIENECPECLRKIANEIKVRLSKADKQTQQAQDHLIAVERLLAEAKSLCDDGGFQKFRELFCPQLGKSQAYALLSIAAGKKTLADHRMNERDRKRQSRKALRAAAENSGTVPEKADPTTASQDTPAVPDESAGDGVGVGSPADPAKCQTVVAPKDEAVFAFTASVMNLLQKTKGVKFERFVSARVPAEDLAKLGRYLSNLAGLKEATTAGPSITLDLQDSRAPSSEQPPEEEAKAGGSAIAASTVGLANDHADATAG
jgi:hypothetical protein